MERNPLIIETHQKYDHSKSSSYKEVFPATEREFEAEYLFKKVKGNKTLKACVFNNSMGSISICQYVVRSALSKIMS